MKSKSVTILTYAAILVASSMLVYLPGINGPFVFDDIANIVTNDFLRITDLGLESIRRAAFSSDFGTLNRPIPVLSFALNYYFADGLKNTFQFKFTNVLIHSINSLLIFWFMLLALKRLIAIDKKFSTISHKQVVLFSFVIALLWALHPIQLTSVLYIVQRMTSMSAMFVLLSLIAYIKSRTMLIENSISPRIIIGFSAAILFSVLGLFSKENAALIPVYILLIELVLFSQEKPWRFWATLDNGKRFFVITVLVVAIFVSTVYLIDYFSAGYRGRTFTLVERLLTEPRILMFYLSLIFLPRINAFGIYHDDIPISTSIVTPWSTLPTVGVLLLLVSLSIFYLNKNRVFAFGVLWFFACHLIESTFLPLEIAHEHRNYLASLGPVILIVYLTYLAFLRIRNKKVWIVPVLFLALFSANTSLRAWHWSDLASLTDFEVRNHPDSARAQASLGSMLAEAGKLNEAKLAFRRAADLRPYEVTDLINILIIMSWQKQQPDEELLQTTLSRVRTGLITSLTTQAIGYSVSCASKNCAQMQGELLEWLPIYAERTKRNPKRHAFFRFLYARMLLLDNRKQDAIDNLQLAIKSYPKYLHPYFFLTSIYIQSGDLDKAEKTLNVLVRANRKSMHPRDKEIKILSNKIQSLKTGG